MEAVQRSKRFLRFRRDAEGNLSFHGIVSLKQGSSAADILFWQDRGVEAIWTAAAAMVGEAQEWKDACDEAKDT